MPVIAVINRKGGSGKSTLATQLAGHCANVGLRTMLGDTDKQQSTQAWLRVRAAQALPKALPIVGWALDPKSVMRPPAGISHVVLDTPGGMRGFELAKVVSHADAVLMPVGPSLFDRSSAAECFEELKALPRVASGRCKVGAIGMRLDARTKADELIARWAESIELPFIGVLRETQVYVRCVEQGLTLFDLPASQVATDRVQWRSILEWLDPVLHPVAAPEVFALKPTRPCTVPGELAPVSLRSVRVETPPPAPRRPEPVPSRAVPLGILEAAPKRGVAQRVAEWFGGWSTRRPGRA
jgi:chromosome partitioning protein